MYKQLKDIHAAKTGCGAEAKDDGARPFAPVKAAAEGQACKHAQGIILSILLHPRPVRYKYMSC